MWSQHGVPSTCAAIVVRISRTGSYASGGPPGMMLGPSSAPSSPPEMPVPRKWMPLLGQRRLAPPGVVEVRVAAVDDDVALVEQRHELVDDGVDGLARLDHDHDAARPVERGHELLKREGRREGALVPVPLHQLLGTAVAPIVNGHREPVPRDVAREVLAHYGESGDTDLASHTTTLTLRPRALP